MAGQRLQGKTVAIVATDGAEQVELLQPLEAPARPSAMASR